MMTHQLYTITDASGTSTPVAQLHKLSLSTTGEIQITVQQSASDPPVLIASMNRWSSTIGSDNGKGTDGGDAKVGVSGEGAVIEEFTLNGASVDFGEVSGLASGDVSEVCPELADEVAGAALLVSAAQVIAGADAGGGAEHPGHQALASIGGAAAGAPTAKAVDTGAEVGVAGCATAVSTVSRGDCAAASPRGAGSGGAGGGLGRSSEISFSRPTLGRVLSGMLMRAVPSSPACRKREPSRFRTCVVVSRVGFTTLPAYL